MSHGLFNRCPYYVSGYISVVLLSMQGQEALGFHQKYINVCSEDEQNKVDCKVDTRLMVRSLLLLFTKLLRTKSSYFKRNLQNHKFCAR